jgi:murein DD-endopeptidase MepM/ murein hydrolase activator NlpD
LKKRHIISLFILLIIAIGFLIPQKISMPVKGATQADYNKDTFWYYPWGKSITHKGVDIFAKEGTILKSATSGLVLFTGEIKVGGNVVLILGPKWRFHYYAHLKEIKTTSWTWANKDMTIGTVGSSGNAKGKPAHLHYSIGTPIPYIWCFDTGIQGWKKMFYLNPIDYFSEK